MVCASHDGFRSPKIAQGIHAAITGSAKGDMELRDMKRHSDDEDWVMVAGSILLLIVAMALMLIVIKSVY